MKLKFTPRPLSKKESFILSFLLSFLAGVLVILYFSVAFTTYAREGELVALQYLVAAFQIAFWVIPIIFGVLYFVLKDKYYVLFTISGGFTIPLAISWFVVYNLTLLYIAIELGIITTVLIIIYFIRDIRESTSFK